MAERPTPPAECAHCGAAIPPRAQACPECGADERSGWREQSLYDGLDLPESAWGDEAGRASGPAGRAPRVNGLAWYWWLVGLAVLAALVLSVTGLR